MTGIFEDTCGGNGIYQSFTEQGNTVVGYFKGNWLDGIAKFSNTDETYVG